MKVHLMLQYLYAKVYFEKLLLFIYLFFNFVIIPL
jgi:hypothetical protein